MTLIDILEIMSDSANVTIIDSENLETLATYDGRGNIPTEYNGAKIEKIDHDAHSILIYIFTE